MGEVAQAAITRRQAFASEVGEKHICCLVRMLMFGQIRSRRRHPAHESARKRIEHPIACPGEEQS